MTKHQNNSSILYYVT